MLDLKKLAKIWKLITSPNVGEAAAALNQARVMVEREGKTLADVPRLLLATQEPEPSKPAATTLHVFNFEGFEDFLKANEPGYRARRAREDAERRQLEKDDLAKLLKRYGSIGNILLPTQDEVTLRNAVLQWCVFYELPDDTSLIASIDGQECPYPLDEVTARVRDALSKAIPLPTSITEALAEFETWERRNRDLCLALDSDSCQLDLPSGFREEIVRNLLEVGLRARSIEEVLIRQRIITRSDMSEPTIETAVLLDLEALVARQGNNNQVSITSSKTSKRQERSAMAKPKVKTKTKPM